MSHEVTRPAGSEIEPVFYYNCSVCCMPYWLLVGGPSCPTRGLFQDHGKDCGDCPRHLCGHAPLPADAAWPHTMNGSLLF